MVGIASASPTLLPHRKRPCLSKYNPDLTQPLAHRGNNVIVFKGDRVQRQTSAGPSFFSFYNDTFDPSLPANAVAAQTNAFFVANAVHDFAYRYGFTEEKFNFQLNNFGKGGKENDRVLLSVQDASGKNNANFATPPEYVFFFSFGGHN